MWYILNTIYTLFIFNYKKHIINMTITVNSTTELVSINNSTIPASVNFVLTSGLSRVPETLLATRTEQNDRYSTIEITFPEDFKNEHFNGVYYYSIEAADIQYEAGYVKIITDPGGSNGSVQYVSTPEIENRESKVYYRPQY